MLVFNLMESLHTQIPVEPNLLAPQEPLSPELALHPLPERPAAFSPTETFPYNPTDEEGMIKPGEIIEITGDNLTLAVGGLWRAVAERRRERAEERVVKLGQSIMARAEGADAVLHHRLPDADIRPIKAGERRSTMRNARRREKKIKQGYNQLRLENLYGGVDAAGREHPNDLGTTAQRVRLWNGRYTTKEIKGEMAAHREYNRNESVRNRLGNRIDRTIEGRDIRSRVQKVRIGINESRIPRLERRVENLDRRREEARDRKAVRKVERADRWRDRRQRAGAFSRRTAARAATGVRNAAGRLHNKLRRRP